ncbi:uncharacterized protein LOC130677670 [Microplitis mediator]|uniref:uncharacterized protein LOC130677670 n=1 Tax=Microplitis mediator TaxID=375433 RepID=UPI002554916D|nr:uncharacterized protein LOC130677670 [Microplitis mediator]
MEGEMVFIHHDKPIEDVTVYEQLVKNIMNECQEQLVPVEFNSDNPTEILSEDEKEIIIANGKNLGTDDDWIVGVDLQKSKNSDNELIPGDGHFYILFPKDPNTHKIISNMNARGFSEASEIKDWIHDWSIQFVVTFPGVFEFYYKNGSSGFDDKTVTYSNGRDSPVETQ